MEENKNNGFQIKKSPREILVENIKKAQERTKRNLLRLVRKEKNPDENK